MSANQYANLSNPGVQPAGMEQVTVATAGSAAPNPKDRHKFSIYKLGISEVVLGGVCCVLWLVSIIMAVTAPPRCYDYGSGSDCYSRSFGVTYVSSGLWCGVFPIVSGALAIHMRNRPTTCMYSVNMAFSILASVMMGVLLIMSSIAAGVWEAYSYPLIRIPHILLGIFALAIMIVCIVHSALCCAGVCCQRRSQGRITYTAPPQQYVQLPNGQLMLVQAQPMLPQNYPVMMNQPAGFQPTPVLAAPASPMMQPATGVYPTAAMPVTAIPSQPAPTQVSMPQPATVQAKPEGAPQSYPTNPPGYDA